MKIIITTPIWGEEYTRFFVDYALPSLLCDGNLHALGRDFDCRYVLHTDAVGQAILEDSPAFAALSEIMAVDLRVFVPEWRHTAMIKCHNECLDEASRTNAGLIVISPDCIWSSDSLRHLKAIIDGGKRLVYICGLRCDKSRSMDSLGAHRTGDGTLAMSTAALARLAIDAPHEITRTHYWEDDDTDLMPAYLIWRLDDDALLIRGFSQAILFMKPERAIGNSHLTVDGAIGEILYRDDSAVHLETDNNRIMCVEFSSPARSFGTVCPKGDFDGIMNWVERYTTPRGRRMAEVPVRVSVGSVEPDQWQALVRQSGEIVTTILDRRRRSLPYLLLHHQDQAVARLAAFWHGQGDFYSFELAPGRVLGRVKDLLRPVKRFLVTRQKSLRA